MKKELAFEEKINLLEKEIGLLGEEAEKARLDLEESADLLKIEIESLKVIFKELIPDFQKKFSDTKDYVLREINPEWPEEKKLETQGGNKK
jgi:hypothetical protein